MAASRVLGRAGVVLDDGDEVGNLVVREVRGLVNHLSKSFLARFPFDNIHIGASGQE